MKAKSEMFLLLNYYENVIYSQNIFQSTCKQSENLKILYVLSLSHI